MHNYNVAACKHSYEVAILAYFELGGLKNSEVAHLAHHIARETLHSTIFFK